MTRRLLLLACFGASCLSAQLQLFQVQVEVQPPDYEAPVFQQYNFEKCSVCNSVGVQFRLRNTGTAPTPLTILSVDPPFTIVNAPQLPQTVPANGAVDFTVQFAPSQPIGYSANLVADGVSVVLVGTGVAGLTISVSGGGAVAAPLTAGAAIDFGTVAPGASAAMQVVITNPSQTAVALIKPQLVTGAAFQLKTNPLPGTLDPGASITLEVDFTPTSSGPQQDALEINQCSIPLSGVGAGPSAGQLAIGIDIANKASSEQGTLTVGLPSSAQTRVTGQALIVFHPTSPDFNADNGIVFLTTGTLSAPFTVNPGGTASLAFQTGTTAGDIVFTVTLGDSTQTQTLTIAPAAVSVDSGQAQRTSAGLDLLVSAFDNTRSASAMIFTFFDRSGAALTPGAITVNGTAAFQQYFYSSNEGGLFSMHAFFPVNGDPAQVASVEVQIVNSVGTTATAKLAFTTP